MEDTQEKSDKHVGQNRTKTFNKDFLVSVEVKLYCLNIDCANNIKVQQTCNLKGVFIDENGVCSGIVNLKKKKDKKQT